MRACSLVLIALAGCGAAQHGGNPACQAHWTLGELEQRDPLTSTWDVSQVEPGPLWTGDLDHDGRPDVVLRYRGSRVHASVVLHNCGAGAYEVLLDEVRASQVGTTPGEGGWDDLVLVDGKHRGEYKHGPGGYEAPKRTLGEDFDWQ